jgi:hypothetical protein
MTTIPEVKTSAKRYWMTGSGIADPAFLARGRRTIPANMRAKRSIMTPEASQNEINDE